MVKCTHTFLSLLPCALLVFFHAPFLQTPVHLVAFSVLLVACNFSGDALEAELQASILGVLGQFWTFLQAKQVRGFTVLTVKA